MRFALPVMLALLVAGCTAAPAPAPSTSAATTPHVLAAQLATPSVLPDLQLGDGFGEPNIAVAPDGTVYETPIAPLYRSVDGGHSFKSVRSDLEGQGDGDIAVGPSGRLHWLGLFGSDNMAIPYQHSDDQGASFSHEVDLSAKDLHKGGTGADREWIDATGDGWLYAAWRDSAEGGSIRFRASPDDGSNWTSLVTVGPDALTGPVVHGPDSKDVYIPMTVFQSAAAGFGGTFKIALAVSHDHGATWTVNDVATPVQPATREPLVDEGTSIFPVAAVDKAGTVYVVYSVGMPTEGQGTPKHATRYGVYLTSGKGAANWTAPVLISDPNTAAILPFVAAGAEGRIAVVWYENTLGLPNDALPDLWNVRLWESIDADSAAPHSVRVLLNTAPNHIGAVCTYGGACLFTASDRSLLDYFEVALDARGQPVVAWVSSAAGTAVGIAAQSVKAHFGGVADGTPLA